MTSSEFGAPPSLAALRERITHSAPDPATDPQDFRLLKERAVREISGRALEERVSEVRVRVAGDGVIGHDLPVAVASELLGTLQGAITAVGSHVKRSKKLKTPQKSNGRRMGIRAATEFRMTPSIAPGSIVFHLRGAITSPPDAEALLQEPDDTLADVAVREMLSLLARAQEDEIDDLTALTAALRQFGALAASKFDAIAATAIANDLVLDLGHRSITGTRRAARLNSRGARAIRAAAESNRIVDDEETLVGILNTASDGHDQLRMTLEDGSQIRMKAHPEVGASMGRLLGQRVSVEVTTTIQWNLSKGTEKRTYRLRSVTPANQ